MTSAEMLQIGTLPKELQGRAAELIKKCPEIASFLDDLIDHLKPELHHKKTKISTEGLGSAIITFPELSFIFPVRKKLKLAFHSSSISVSSKDGVENVMDYKDIQQIFCIETPGKTKPHSTVLIIPSCNFPILPCETIAFGLDDVIPKFKLDTARSVRGQTAKDLVQSSFRDIIKNVNLQTPSRDVFVSSLPGPAKFHVNCFLKAKDGHLFFFDTGVLFGLKKPSMFYKIDTIDLLEVTAVTGRFFNLYLKLKAGETIEFAMIEVGEYDGVAAYIKKYVKKGNTVTDKDEEVVADVHPQDIMLAPSDEEDHDYESVHKSDASIAEEFDSDHDTGTENSESDEENGSAEDDEDPQNIAPAVLVEKKTPLTVNRPKPGMPVERARPGQPVNRGAMQAHFAEIERQLALKKKKEVLRKQEEDLEEDLQNTSGEDSVDGSADSVVILTPSGNEDDLEVDELQ